MSRQTGGGRVTPKTPGGASKPKQSQRPKVLAIILIVLVLAGLVAGTIGSMVGSGTTATTVPVTAPPG